jgi:hypothetical protein
VSVCEVVRLSVCEFLCACVHECVREGPSFLNKLTGNFFQKLRCGRVVIRIYLPRIFNFLPVILEHVERRWTVEHKLCHKMQFFFTALSGYFLQFRESIQITIFAMNVSRELSDRYQ